MAYIESFVVWDLAGREEPVEHQLDRYVNIFWGLNGTGKTSLLKILHAALRNSVDGLTRVPFSSAEVTFRSTDHNATLKRSIDLTERNNSDEDDDDLDDGVQLEPAGDGIWREVPRTEVGWTTEVIELGTLRPSRRLPTGRPAIGTPEAPFKHSYMPISRLSQVSERVRGASQSVDDEFLDEEFARYVRQRWQVYNASALARIRGIQQQGLATILALLFGGQSNYGMRVGSDTVEPQDAYDLVTGFLREQQINLRIGSREFVRRYEEQSDLRQVVGSIQEVTREVEETLRPQHDFQDVIESLFSGAKNLKLDAGATTRSSIQVQIAGQPIPLQSLSSGEKQLLRLMLEALAAEETLVMIDEPELSMHVDWQQVLVASMRRVNPDCQLLFATHSPEVMAEVYEGEVFEL